MAINIRRTFAALMLFVASAGVHAQTQTVDFVTTMHGDLPVILSAPHGGRDRMPGIPERVRPEPGAEKTGARWGGFHGGAGDTGTLELTEKVAARLKTRLGNSPYVILDRAQRRYVDVNRPADLAYDPPGTDGPKAVYDTYHRALAAAVQDVTRRFGRGLLLDIHGQGDAAETVFRGTNDGRTVSHLLKRSGQPALTGPESIFGVFAAKGYAVNPAIGSTDREDRRYNGGYIVATYGSRAGGSVDAIQLEFGTALRARARLDRTADDLADAVVRFAKTYLP